MDELNDNTTASEVAPALDLANRGDLIHRLAEFLDKNQHANVIGVRDPVSDIVAPMIVSRDAEGNQSVFSVAASQFDEYLDAPRFRRGTANLTDLDSFIAHVERFKDEESIVFACDNREKPSLTAVLDYHPANQKIEEADGRIGAPPPRFGRHRSQYAFPLSDEWEAWNQQNNTFMSMADFALFLEDRIVDVAAPGEIPLSDAANTFISRIGGKDRIATPSDLITLSRGLRVNQKNTISNQVNLSSGEGEIMFASDHTDMDGNKLTVPTSFQIAIPVFRSGPLYGVIARLRYVASPALQFKYELWRVDRVFDAAFKEDVDRVAEETGLPVLLGSPE